MTEDDIQLNNRVTTEYSEMQLDPKDYSPIILVPTDIQKQCIDAIVLEIARVYKTKIIDLIEPLCEYYDIGEDCILDSTQIADGLTEIAKEEDDYHFLQLFAYTQTFSFLLEQYQAMKNQTTTEPHDSLTFRESPDKVVRKEDKSSLILVENMDTAGNEENLRFSNLQLIP